MPPATTARILTAIPVYTDPKVPAGTAMLDHDPQDPRHITGIRAASDVVLTAEQIEQVRDHFRAMDERAGQALDEWARLTQTITGGPASEPHPNVDGQAHGPSRPFWDHLDRVAAEMLDSVHADTQVVDAQVATGFEPPSASLDPAATAAPLTVEKLSIAVPVAEGVCEACGQPLRYNLAAGVIQHNDPAQNDRCREPFPALTQPVAARQAALLEAYWKIRDHASTYRSTTPVRKVRERWENTGCKDQELGRTAAINEFYARGIEAAARDLAELLGVPEHEIERPEVEPQ